MKNNNYVKASEIGEYVFCKRVWWLRENGYLRGKIAQMIFGTQDHERLSRELNNFNLIKTIAWCVLVTGLAALVLIGLYVFLL